MWMSLKKLKVSLELQKAFEAKAPGSEVLEKEWRRSGGDRWPSQAAAILVLAKARS